MWLTATRGELIRSRYMEPQSRVLARRLTNSFVVVSYRGVNRATRVIENTSAPVFDEDVPVPVYVEDL